MAIRIEGIRFFSVPEIAQALDVTPQSVRMWIKNGKLKGVRVGRPILVSEQNFKEFLRVKGIIEPQ